MNRNRRGAAATALLGVILCLPFVGWAAVRGYRAIKFNQDCEGHLENAAAANQITQALPEMEMALNYMSEHGMTQGYTSVIYNTQDENVGYWYTNLKSATDELRAESANKNMTPLEQSNVLLKLDNTLRGAGEHGNSIRLPSGISAFPSNGMFCLLGWFFLLLGAVGVVIVGAELSDS